MAEFKRISFVVLMLAVVFCSAFPTRNRQIFVAKKVQHLKQRPAVLQKRAFARQEAVTPYPTADELKPETPFEERNIPDEVYGPPDEIYGPPDADQTPADQLPSEEAPEEFAPNSGGEVLHTEEKIVSPLKGHILRLTKGKKPGKKILPSRLLVNKRHRLIENRGKFIASPTLSASMPLSSYTQYLFSNQPFAYNTNY